MKTKARDIIPAWPRSKSTTTEYPYPLRYPLRLFEFGRSAAMDAINADSQYWMAVEEEARLTRAYHAEQQSMVDDYRRAWRQIDNRIDGSALIVAVARWRVQPGDALEQIRYPFTVSPRNPRLRIENGLLTCDRGKKICLELRLLGRLVDTNCVPCLALLNGSYSGVGLQ